MVHGRDGIRNITSDSSQYKGTQYICHTFHPHLKTHSSTHIANKISQSQNSCCLFQILLMIDTQSETQYQISEEHIPQDSLTLQHPHNADS